jgi:arginine utilization protein RocB
MFRKNPPVVLEARKTHECYEYDTTERIYVYHLFMYFTYKIMKLV